MLPERPYRAAFVDDKDGKRQSGVFRFEFQSCNRFVSKIVRILCMHGGQYVLDFQQVIFCQTDIGVWRYTIVYSDYSIR